MVYDKSRSGDPDYDDKVPADQHSANVVTAGDGSPVIMSKSNGPISPQGEHVNLDDPAGTARDNRPAPGQVATEASEVQTYDAGDTPAADNDLGEVGSQAEAEAAVAKSEKPARAARAREGATDKGTTK
jgi:hypothetical protein